MDHPELGDKYLSGVPRRKTSLCPGYLAAKWRGWDLSCGDVAVCAPPRHSWKSVDYGASRRDRGRLLRRHSDGYSRGSPPLRTTRIPDLWSPGAVGPGARTDKGSGLRVSAE